MSHREVQSLLQLCYILVMWIFTKHGFYSAVQDETDSSVIKVRARVRDDLVRLIEACNIKSHIVETTDTDYAYRIFISRSELMRVMIEMVDDLDYLNFKSEVFKQQGIERYSAYHDVWEVMYKLQLKEHAAAEVGRYVNVSQR